MLDIVILDENYDLLIRIYNILKKYDSFKVQSIYADSKSTKEYLLNEKVDILIINYNNSLNQFKLIKQIREKGLDIKIMLVIESAADLDKLINNNIYVDDFIIKRFEEKQLIDKLQKISKDFRRKEDIINIRVEKILRKFNFNKTSRGYYYIVDCLNYCINNEYDYIKKIYEICDSVSAINKSCTRDQIIWDMTKTIKSMTRLTDTEILKKYFPFNPTLTTKSFLNEILGIYYTIYRK